MTCVVEEECVSIAGEPLAELNSGASPTRVLHLINGEHYAGAERVQDLLAAGLQEFGFEVAFACLKRGRFAEMRQTHSAPLFDLAMRSRWDLTPVLRIARLIREERFALIHTHTPRTALLGRVAARLARVPVVHHVHSPTSNDSTRRIRNLANAWIERRSMAQAARVVAVSGTLSHYARKQGVDASRIRTVHNGVPACESSHRDPPQGTWTLGVVALFRPRKGLEVLLEALAELRDAGLPVRLLAVGPFETEQYQREIFEQVDRLQLAGLIEWTGFTADVHSQLRRMDAFVLPSLFGEGLPMVVLEAMAAGVPVVATQVEGVPEAVRDGLDGLLAAPRDASDLAAKLQSLIGGAVDWQQLRMSAQQRQRESFSDRSMAASVAEIYREVLNP